VVCDDWRRPQAREIPWTDPGFSAAPGTGGLLFTWMLFRFQLVPRFISVVGLIGYALVFLGGIAGWFDLIEVAPGGNGTPLAVPVAVWEIILLPFWLFIRGFSMPEATEKKQELLSATD